VRLVAATRGHGGERREQRERDEAPEEGGRHRAGLAASRRSASVWIYGASCFTGVRQLANPRREEWVADRDTIWSRGGVPVEELPDPFAPEAPPHFPPEAEQPEAPRRRRWVLWFYAVSAILILTLAWLVVTAPLSRALEPLDDPAL